MDANQRHETECENQSPKFNVSDEAIDAVALLLLDSVERLGGAGAVTPHANVGLMNGTPATKVGQKNVRMSGRPGGRPVHFGIGGHISIGPRLGPATNASGHA